MKILFAMRSVAHFTYHESTIRALCESGAHVDILFDQRWSKDYTDRAARAFALQHTEITIAWMQCRNDVWRRLTFPTRELLSYTSYLNRPDQDDFYARRWAGYIPGKTVIPKSAILKRILRTELGRSAMRMVERAAPADSSMKKMLASRCYDVVVSSPTNLRFDEEIELIKAAKSLGIPTIIPVASWDNLTTKGLIHIKPDVLMVWNETQKTEAIEIHGVHPDAIVITGSPFMDKWYDSDSAPLSEAEFRRRVGLDSERPYVLYLGSSVNISGNESWLVERLADSLATMTQGSDCGVSILARPHPANENGYAEISNPSVIAWTRGRDELPDSPDTIAEYRAALEYASCVIGVNTTGMVDAVILDRPVIALQVEEYKESNAARAVHYKYILAEDVYTVVSSTAECADIVEDITAGADSKKHNRRKFALKYIRPRGFEVQAGVVASQAVMMAANGMPAREINQALGPVKSTREEVRA